MTFEAGWAKAAPWVEAALEHAGSTHALADVEAMVRNHEARFWLGTNAALVTTIDDHPRLKALHLWLGGGDMDELVNHLRPLAEAWGREQGCIRVTELGRPGWERALARHGYRLTSTLLVKEL